MTGNYAPEGDTPNPETTRLKAVLRTRKLPA